MRRAGRSTAGPGADAGPAAARSGAALDLDKAEFGNRTRRTRQATDMHLFSVESGTRTTGVAGRPSATSTGLYSRRRTLRLDFRAVRAIFGSRKVPNEASELGALGGTRTPNLLIRRSGRTVQGCPVVAVCWPDFPGPSFCVGSWLWSWLQSTGCPQPEHPMNPNRISSSGQSGPGRFRLDQRACWVLRG